MFINQYLLKNSAYINFIYLMILYKVLHTKHFEIRRFNRRFSRIRINIKHAFDILKDRGKNFIKLRLRVRNKKNYTYVIRGIIVCVVLHNILMNIRDDGDENEKGWISEIEKAHNEELRLLNSKQLAAGLAKREHVKELMLNED